MTMRSVLRLTMALVMGAAIVGCGGAGAGSPERGEAEGAHAEMAAAGEGGHAHGHGPELGLAANGELPGYSLYHLEGEWWDQSGEMRSLESLGGRVQLVTMVYTNCGFACPRIIGEMKRLESDFAERYGDEVGYVLVSIDPERDTPERLAQFAADTNLDPARWTLLSADDDQVMELAAVLGVRFYRESETDFAHTNMIAVLDEMGQVQYRQVGVGERDDQTVGTVRRLLE